MNMIDPDIITQLSALADRLPADKCAKVQDLIAGWREDVRRSPRVPYLESLSITGASVSYPGHARDISGTGVFIETAAQIELGEHVDLELIFISALNPIRLSGNVVRISADGVGVVFDANSPDQIKRLDALINKHELIMLPPHI